MDPARSGARRLPPGAAWDIVVLGVIVVFAVLAVQLHRSVAGLGDMADGIRQTGVEIRAAGRTTADEIRGGIGNAADALESIPFVGSQVAGRVREAGRNSAQAVERQTRA